MQMQSSEKQWFVMRDLKRRNSNSLAIHELVEAGFEAFTPMTQMIMTIGGRQQRRSVPVIQDLLFVHESKEVLDPFVASRPNLQYRYLFGKAQNTPMVVRKEEMDRFIFAICNSETPIYYKPGELTKSMYGKYIRIIGGVFNNYEGRLLSIKGMRKRRLIIELSDLLTVAVEVDPDYIQIIK